MASPARRKAWLALRAVVSVGVLAYLVTVLDRESLAAIAQRVDLPWLALPPLLVLFNYACMGRRWSVLLAARGIDLPTLESFRLYVVSSFYGLMLPGVVGGDAIRVPAARKVTGASLGELTLTVLMERAVGLATLLLVGGGAALLMPASIADPLGRPLVLTASALGLGAAAALPVGRQIAAWIGSRWDRDIQLPGAVLARLVAWTAPGHVADCVGAYALARALGMDVPLAAFLLVLPVAHIATVVPVSLGGLGVREGVLTLLLVRLGGLPADAVALALLIYVNRLVLTSVAAGVDLLRSGRSAGRDLAG